MSDNSLEKNVEYQVLARKYRPSTFSDLVGQDIIVKILENSFLSNRIAHAFMLTGVRGVGKTTTARIIAKGLNCVGLDGLGDATTLPCQGCENCLSIAKGSHVDVIEFDAASRTGVSDIREIIDSIYYRAASARFKIYVIDEVHMLSTSAFNALLKTLEEPPKHVKFIFATTEINKVPATVLSRCQRFDLRRIEPKNMIDYLQIVARQERFSIDDDCLGQIARASEGSMRDALSLLEKIFVDTDGKINIDSVRAILGLSDRGRILDLFELLSSGKVSNTLDEYNNLYNDGADPLSLLKELCEITHWITVLKVSPKLINDVTTSPDERSRGKIISDKMSVRELARLWQLLVKIVEESSVALNVKMSVEMGLIRVCYASDLPTPDELIRKISNEQTDLGEKDKTKGTFNSLRSSLPPQDTKSEKIPVSVSFAPSEVTVLKTEVTQEVQSQEERAKSLIYFEQVIELIRLHRDIELLIEVEDNLRLVSYQAGRIEFEPTAAAAADLASRLTSFLKMHSSERWMVSVVSSGGGRTIKEDRLQKQFASEKESRKNPIVSAVFDKFPGAKIEKIHNKKLENVSKTEQVVTTGNNYEWEPFEKE
jgi:DNA polymerase-3 subunit gamma/tau